MRLVFEQGRTQKDELIDEPQRRFGDALAK